MTYTVATLDVPAHAYDAIREVLRAADPAQLAEREGEHGLDLTHIALVRGEPEGSTVAPTAPGGGIPRPCVTVELCDYGNALRFSLDEIHDGVRARSTWATFNKTAPPKWLAEWIRSGAQLVHPDALERQSASRPGVDGLRQGNWHHPDGGRIVGWVIEREDADRMGADCMCLPKEVAEALANLRDGYRTDVDDMTMVRAASAYSRPGQSHAEALRAAVAAALAQQPAVFRCTGCGSPCDANGRSVNAPASHDAQQPACGPARDLLAREYEADGFHKAAAWMRDPQHVGMTHAEAAALRAIDAALAQQPAGDGVRPFGWYRPRGDQEPEFRTSPPPDGHGWLPVPGFVTYEELDAAIPKESPAAPPLRFKEVITRSPLSKDELEALVIEGRSPAVQLKGLVEGGMRVHGLTGTAEVTEVAEGAFDVVFTSATRGKCGVGFCGQLTKGRSVADLAAVGVPRMVQWYSDRAHD